MRMLSNIDFYSCELWNIEIEARHKTKPYDFQEFFLHGIVARFVEEQIKRPNRWKLRGTEYMNGVLFIPSTKYLAQFKKLQNCVKQ